MAVTTLCRCWLGSAKTNISAILLRMETKTCTKCHASKPLDAFHLLSHGKKGRHPRCKECRLTQERERYALDPQRQMQRPNRSRSVALRYERKRKYGITEEQMQARLAAQKNLCAICKFPLPLCVDHCHTSSLVRGLLCSSCNIGLGHFKDDPVRLQAAIEYLEGWQSGNAAAC